MDHNAGRASAAPPTLDAAWKVAELTRARGELPEPEEALLGIERPTLEQEAEAEKHRKENDEIRRLYLIGLIQNELFRAWLMEQLNAFQTFANPLAVSPTGFPDPMATQFHLGMKAAGWMLWTTFDDRAPELTSLMRREASKQRP